MLIGFRGLMAFRVLSGLQGFVGYGVSRVRVLGYWVCRVYGVDRVSGRMGFVG